MFSVRVNMPRQEMDGFGVCLAFHQAGMLKKHPKCDEVLDLLFDTAGTSILRNIVGDGGIWGDDTNGPIPTIEPEEGVVYATYSLGRKLAQGVGSSLVSFLLIPTGFVAGGLIDPTTGNPSMALQPDGTSTNVRILLGLVYIVCFAIQFALLLWVYNLDKKTLAEVSAKLGREENTIENAKSMDD